MTFKPATVIGKVFQTRPELLLHPNIPKPMHGVAPRVIWGEDWWERTRKKAYAAHGYRCIACGVRSRDAKYRQYLEAHETYHIDYEKRFMLYNGTVALCHSCHNYIHCGRLMAMLNKKEADREYVLDIMNHGKSVLTAANLQQSLHQQILHTILRGEDPPPSMITQLQEELGKGEDGWEDWILIAGEEEHGPKFKNYQEWLEYYN